TTGEVSAGSRAAVNLSGLDVEDLARGDVLVHPGSLRATSIVDVEITPVPGERALKDGARLRVHAASAEILARGRLLQPGPLSAAGLAQLRLERPVAVGRGDRLILRSYSPSLPIAGAGVLGPPAPR